MDGLKIKCNLCDHRSDTWKHLRTHLNTLHPDCRVGYECFFCSRLLKSPYDHRRHLIRRHGDHCDLTTPPPTGRFDPKKASRKPEIYTPPVEARTLPLPPKRARITPTETTSICQAPPMKVFDIDELLRDDLQFSEDEPMISPIISPTRTPITQEKGIQVRRRDFLTTSREIQTTTNNVDSGIQTNIVKTTYNVNTQTVSNHVDASVQTEDIETPAIKNQSIQTQCETSDTSTQVSFFNAGWLTRVLTEAIRAISPTIMTSQNSLSIREMVTINPYLPEPGTESETPRRHGRPRRASSPTNNQ